MVHGLKTLKALNDQASDSTIKADCSLSHLVDGDYSRENLVAICEAAVVQESKWRDRDSPSAHEKLGLCWVMLKAGCEFHVHPPNDGSGCHTDERTIWISIDWKTFSSFEYGGGNKTNETFYIPTPKRLRESIGKDWY